MQRLWFILVCDIFSIKYRITAQGCISDVHSLPEITEKMGVHGAHAPTHTRFSGFDRIFALYATGKIRRCMMFNGFCHFGNWGPVGSFGGWGWVGLILNLVFWVGLIVGFALLIILAVRRAQVPVAQGPDASDQRSAKEILQAQYAHGKINREQYLQKLEDIS